jgi:hypothetical protein
MQTHHQNVSQAIVNNNLDGKEIGENASRANSDQAQNTINTHVNQNNNGVLRQSNPNILNPDINTNNNIPLLDHSSVSNIGSIVN